MSDLVKKLGSEHRISHDMVPFEQRVLTMVAWHCRNSDQSLNHEAMVSVLYILYNQYTLANRILIEILYIFNTEISKCYSTYVYERDKKQHTPGYVDDVVSAFALDIDTLQ